MKNENSNIKHIMIAAIAGVLFMLVSGAGFRVLAAWLEDPVSTLVMSTEDLNKLPLKIGDWSGKDVPLDEAVIKATGTDAHLNRQYFNEKIMDTVVLYIAYGTRGRDLMPHRPEVCYTGSGWTLIDKQTEELSLNDDLKLPCRILQFSRTERVIVLDYYLVDGLYSSDVSLLRSKASRGSGTIRYVAQIQIVTSFNGNREKDSKIKNACDFAVESAPLISDLFEKRRDANEPDGSIAERDKND